jgi:hypothetical protein
MLLSEGSPFIFTTETQRGRESKQQGEYRERYKVQGTRFTAKGAGVKPMAIELISC